MKIAFIYDRINKWGGAERLLLALHEVWPKAPLYTAVYNPQTAAWANGFEVNPSFLQKFPLAKSRHEVYPLLMPLAFESFNFDQFDVVISVTSEAAKGIITKPTTCHICYCLTPTRYLWSGYQSYFRSTASQMISRLAIKYLRNWDKIASQRPDFYLAISKTVKCRIKKYYKREAGVLYPPIDNGYWTMGHGLWPKDKYFLLVSRLVSYKKIDIAIQAFNKLGLPLKIVGTGSQMGKLKKMAGKNIKFLGQLTDNKLLSYYQNCQAVIFPQEEDFGLVPLEAQLCGRPVVAFKSGGALETVIEGKTGLFFYPQTDESLIKAVKLFEKQKFDPVECRKNAERFSKDRFKKEFRAFVEQKWKSIRS